MFSPGFIALFFKIVEVSGPFSNPCQILYPTGTLPTLRLTFARPVLISFQTGLPILFFVAIFHHTHQRL